MNGTVEFNDDSHKDPQTLEYEISQTRAEMDRTLGALERKLSPRHLIDQAMDFVRRNGAGATDSVGRVVRNNPVPLALAGLGFAWLLFRTKSTSTSADADYHYRYGESALDEVEEYERSEEERPFRAAPSADQSAAGLKSRLNAGARWPMDKAHEQSDRLKRGIEVMAHEQPLLLGALGIALGAAIGAALPESESERRWLGPARDGALDKVKQQGKQAYQQVREAAERGVTGVKQAVADAAAGK